MYGWYEKNNEAYLDAISECSSAHRPASHYVLMLIFVKGLGVLRFRGKLSRWYEYTTLHVLRKMERKLVN